jgi:hypothetical protein
MELPGQSGAGVADELRLVDGEVRHAVRDLVHGNHERALLTPGQESGGSFLHRGQYYDDIFDKFRRKKWRFSQKPML